MVERLPGTDPEGSKNKVEKEGGMQKWEYHAAWITVDKNYVPPTDEKGIFGGDKKKKVPTWVGNLPGGDKLPSNGFLQEMGKNSWELVGAAQTSIPTDGFPGISWHDLSHFLYFKRPRMDNQPEK